MTIEEVYTYNVEANIPIPASGGGGIAKGSTWTRYPFAIMDVGDSFLIEGDNSHEWKRARTAASTYGGRNGAKFASRIVGNGLRIWRVE